MLKKIGLLTVFAGLLFSCGKNGFDREDGLQSVTAKDLEQHIKALSSDEFQGRRPFTPGEKKTLNYLETQFNKLGLEPQQLKDSYREKHYHQPSDEYDSTSWNLDGAVDDAKLLFQVGKRLAFEDSWPQWKAGSEFKAVRDSAKK